MVDYALKLTRTPGTITAADVDRLRQAGFEDRAVLDIAQVTAYYNYVNRLADGLGVELEDYWMDEDMTLTREQFEALRGGHGVAESDPEGMASPDAGDGP